MRTILCAMIAVLVANRAPAADLISGVPRIVDGDTIAVGNTKIRLEGIDAPEGDQACLDQKGTKWDCGDAARAHLAEFVGARSVDCVPHGRDDHGRTLATCSLAGENLDARMVRDGWALAYVRFSTAYVREEAEAREAQRGMWSGAFIPPWDWRHHQCEVVLGALMVPVNAKCLLCGPAEPTPKPCCDIKANERGKGGECIYHLPGDLAYSRIDMTKPGRQWFCSRQDAEAAGCRPALR